MFIRMYRASDCEHLAELFYQTVHGVNSKDYTKEQLDVWATGCVDLEKWDKSFSEHYTVVAVKDDRIVGFGDIDKSGYLDRLYVHKDCQKQGIATAICNELEQGVETDKIITHASITAKPFFEHRGYEVVREQQVVRDGIPLTNFVMEVKLMRRNGELGLERFVKAQELDYEIALAEIKGGYKRSHWIWYIFPQIRGLGYSETSKYYAIKDREEAQEYIQHPVLGKRLVEISEALLQLPSNNASEVMGRPDDMKLKSSMTLFSLVSDDPVFQKVLDKFFDGKRDKFTVEALKI